MTPLANLELDSRAEIQIERLSPIVVTGMHRSGTSAVAGLLNEAGIYMGRELLAPQSGVNEKGFFEDERIVSINEALFRLMNREWWAFDPIDEAVWLSDNIAALRDRAIRLLESDFKQHQNWAIKDPRFCHLMPFWLGVFSLTDVKPRFLICVRNADEVAMSLQKRDGFETGVGQILWLQHYVAVEKATRNFNRLFVCYEGLITKDGAESERLSGFLGLSKLPLNFIEDGLQHHHGNPAGNAMANDLYRAMRDVNTGPRYETFDAVEASLIEMQQFFAAPLKNQRLRIAGLSDSYNSAEAIIKELSESYSSAESIIEGLTDSYNSAEGILQNQKEQFDFQQLGLQQGVDQILSANEKIKQQQLEINRLQNLLMEKARNEQIPILIDTIDESEPSVRYEAEIDLVSMNNSHTKVIRQVMTLSTELPVLEVGCSTGYLGGFLKENGYQVWGIEPDSDAARQARTRLNYVFEGTVEAFFEAVNDMQFGAIIFGDVLEHLVDPASVLRKAGKILDREGMIVASIPNVAHLSVRLMLLEGRWEYAQTGILDDTHLRFFTRDSIVDLMDETNLKIVNFDSVEIPWRESSTGINTMLLDKVEGLLADSEGEVYQYVVSATPMLDPVESNLAYKVRSRKKLLCLLPLPDSSLASIRILEPLRKNAERFGSDIRVNSVYKPSPEDIRWCDVVVFQREANDHLLGLIATFRMMGKKVIFDIDDLLLDVPEYLAVHAHCKSMRPFLEHALKYADAVTVSTQPLLEEIGRYNSNTHLVPNSGFSPMQPVSHYETYDDRVTLIVASSDSVRVDFIVDALRYLINQAPDKIRLVGIGPPGKYLFAQQLPVEVYPLMEHGHFRAFLAEQNNAIAWIPLDDSRFNRCKSAVKYFDYSLAGIPVLCSNMVPYSDVVSHGETGFLCSDDGGDWIARSLELMQSVALRKQIARSARENTLNRHGIERTASAWQLAIESLPTRCQTPVKVKATNRVSNFTQAVAKRVLRPSAYVGAARVLRLHGVKGMWNYITSLA